MKWNAMGLNEPLISKFLICNQSVYALMRLVFPYSNNAQAIQPSALFGIRNPSDDYSFIDFKIIFLIAISEDLPP